MGKLRWLLVGLAACTPTSDDRPAWTSAPATIDDGGDDTLPGTEDDSSADDAADTAEPTGDADSSGDAPVEFDPAFVFEQADAAIAAGVPGLAVAVVMDGEVVLAEGFGVADESGTPVDATTLFNMASLTKSVTALTVLSLRDEGRLELDDPVPTIVPEFALLAGHDPASVNVRHLLTHTSGLGDWPNEPFVWADALVDSFASNPNQPLWAPPGTVWNYSNRGFELAGLVAASASGESFADAVDHRVLDPLGMTGATIDGSVASTRTHARGESGGQWLGPLDYASESYEPSGGLWASANDLGELARAYVTADVDGIDASTIEEMLAPIQVTHEWPGAHYGYGMFVDESYDPIVVSHGGSTGGYLADIELLPSEGFGVVVVVNTDAWYPGEMSWAIVEHYRGTVAFADVEEPLDPASIPGTYEEPWHLGQLEVAEGRAGLEMTFVDLQTTVPLEWLWGASYRCTHPTDGYEMSLVFWPDAQGQATAIVGRDGVAPKLD